MFSERRRKMSYSDAIIEECESNGSYQKPDMHVLWEMLKLMKYGFIRYLLAIIVMSVVLTGFNTVTAMLLKSIIARAKRYGTGDVFEGLSQEILFCVLAGIILLVIYAFAFFVYTMEAKKGGANLQKMVYSKCLRLPYSYYENTHSGELMSKAIYDCERAQGIYGSRFRRILMPFLMTCFYLIPMFILSPQVTLCLFGASAALLIINALFVRPMQRVSGEMSKTNVNLTERITTILSGMEQVKIFSLKSMLVERFFHDNDRLRREQNRMNIMSARLDGLNQFFELLGSLVFIALGLIFVNMGITTVDNLAAVYVLYGSMSWNLLQVGLYIPSMASYLTNARRVFDFLDTEEEPERYGVLPHREKNPYQGSSDIPENSAISMREVSFAYEGREELLSGFDIDIAKGKCTALKGESGRGKSTIVKLLLGLYPTKCGKIYMDGRPYESYTLNEIRDRIAFVPQEPYLYDVSIAENIRYGRPGASDEDVIRAAKMANAHEFIVRMEKGYGTSAGERGNRLSGGQRQRIAIARAVLKDASILILDEATSALDNKSEQLVNEALERLMKGRTTILIAHRQSTLDYADEIIAI